MKRIVINDIDNGWNHENSKSINIDAYYKMVFIILFLSVLPKILTYVLMRIFHTCVVFYFYKSVGLYMLIIGLWCFMFLIKKHLLKKELR
ncbi:MAG: hypothetical protein COB60_11460 [Flavobacteriaceae bacterium]|nr:MAG: hypothetical protein COB60_11460 [Flavobacteriaceae bacterium]